MNYKAPQSDFIINELLTINGDLGQKDLNDLISSALIVDKKPSILSIILCSGSVNNKPDFRLLIAEDAMASSLSLNESAKDFTNL